MVSKTGRKRRVPLAEVNGSIDSNEKNEQTKAKKARKEKSQVVQEPTGTILDEASHDTTLTAALEVKHIAAVADIAKILEDRLKMMHKATEERMTSMECAMTNMQSDMTELKEQLQKISSVHAHSAEVELRSLQPYHESISLDDSFCEEPPQPSMFLNRVDAEQPATVARPPVHAVHSAGIPLPTGDAVQPAAVACPPVDTVQPAAVACPLADAVQPAPMPLPLVDAVQPSYFPSAILPGGMQQQSPPFAPRLIPSVNPRYSELSSEEISRSGLISIQ